MSAVNIKTWGELVAYADDTINYPWEAFLEKHIPFFDTLTDAICSAVVIAENIGDTSIQTKDKLAISMLHSYLETEQWSPFLVQIVDTALIFAIENVINLLDALFPSGWNNLIEMLLNMDISIKNLFPGLALGIA